MKTVTIRMQEELASWLSEQGDSMNQTIIDLLNNARYARLYALNELRGKFGEKEWAFLAEALNGNYASDQFRYNKKGLIGHCESIHIFTIFAMAYQPLFIIPKLI